VLLNAPAACRPRPAGRRGRTADLARRRSGRGSRLEELPLAPLANRSGRWPIAPHRPKSRLTSRQASRRRVALRIRLAAHPGPRLAQPEPPRTRRSGRVRPVSTSYFTHTRRGNRASSEGFRIKSGRDRRKPQAWPASMESMAGSTPIFRSAIVYLRSSAEWKISSGSAGQLSQPFAWISLSS
jgi:hypothetical protein